MWLRSAIYSGRCRIARGRGCRRFHLQSSQTFISSLLLRASPQQPKLFQNVTSIKRVAVGGDEAGVRDDPAKFAFIAAIFHAGGDDDGFFVEYAADIVSPQLRPKLADFASRPG